ncbi:membrane protein insertion efficiency factor YidD [Aneurinibacillus sp. Ricciae_BoGa-3]|uniref:membrane protein insertion efficiency factor YidD n=1 Tax=Aneurinibacillus sp. Ricciae_BoGa-3 TaxID=3022697 RepID=UPI002341E656|nr:membrane protein insertion efficiency factor YidD [Aneurinibacillus sp. Ricciae_BoGa-3]WCK54523.1 membrane protein insertion efficiency factor YidD [Aneurinibacillus sp. Ricciae_BoGa-3]
MRLVQNFFISTIKFYRKWLSPLKPPTCRFYPTCSQYAITAIERYGPLHGGWMAFKRILRCHPFHPGGIDEVPYKDCRENT